MKYPSHLIGLALAGAIILNSFVIPAQQTGVWTQTITWGSGTRKEVFNVPLNYNPAKKYKLIVALHGLGGNPTSYMTFFGPMTSGLYENSQVVCNSHLYPCMSPVYDNFIIACPQATGTNTDFWNPVGDTALITRIINDARSMYNIDPEYIYLNGLSLGGRSALRYGLLNYKRFRGIQLWCPAIQSMSEANNLASFNYAYQNAKHIPIVIMVAAQDGQFPQQNQTYRQLYNAGGQVTLQSLYDFCHAPSPDPYTFNAIEFIDKHATSFKNNDAGIYEVRSPIKTIANGTFTPKVILQNKGMGTLTSVVINYQIDNGPVSTLNWTGSLGQLARGVITLPSQTVTAGAHTFKAFTTMPNGVADAVPSNDLVTVNFNYITTGTAANLSEGFELQTQAATGIFQTDWRGPSGWRNAGNDSSYFWEMDTITGGAYGQSASCIHFNNAGVYPNQPAPFNSKRKNSLITPEYDFTNAGAAMLTYDYAYAPITNGSTLLTDSLGIKYSLDCGVTWSYLLKKGGVALNTSGTTTWGSKINGSFFGPTASQWKTENINLGVLAGKPNVIFAFENISDNGNFLYLDNIKLSGVTGLEGSADESERMSVFPNPTSGAVKLRLSESGAAQGGFTPDPVTKISVYNITGKCIYTVCTASIDHEIDLSSQPGGLYFIHVATVNGTIVKKVVRE